LTGSKSLGDVGFLLFFWVVSGDSGKPCISPVKKSDTKKLLVAPIILSRKDRPWKFDIDTQKWSIWKTYKTLLIVGCFEETKADPLKKGCDVENTKSFKSIKRPTRVSMEVRN